MNAATAEPALTQCLRVSISDQILHLPVERVEGVVERERTPPPPLSAPFVSGLVVQGADVLVCFRLSGVKGEARQVKAARLRGADRGCLVEIDHMLGFASIVANGAPATHGFECPVEWIREGRTVTGEEALWLDVEEAFRSLTKAAR